MAENNKQNQTARKTKAQILDEVVEKAHQQKQKKKKSTYHHEYKPKHGGQNKKTNQQKQTTKPKQVVKQQVVEPKKEIIKEQIETPVVEENKIEKIKSVREQVEKEILEQKDLVSQIEEKLKEEEKKIEEIKEEKVEKEETISETKKKVKNARKKRFRASVNIISLIIGILFVISMITMYSLVTYLNILPAKFFIPFTIVSLLFTLLVGFMLCNFKIKKGIKIFFSVIGILVVVVSAVVLNYAIHTFDFLKDISNADLKITEKYYVMVKADSPYNSLEDIATFTMGTFNENTNIYQNAIKKLNELVEVTLVECDSSIQNVDNLLSGESTSILLSNLHKEQYEEEHKDFEKQIKINTSI